MCPFNRSPRDRRVAEPAPTDRWVALPRSGPKWTHTPDILDWVEKAPAVHTLLRRAADEAGRSTSARANPHWILAGRCDELDAAPHALRRPIGALIAGKSIRLHGMQFSDRTRR